MTRHNTTDNPFNIIIDHQLLSDYTQKQYISKLCADINSRLTNNKERSITKINKNREEINIQPEEVISEKNYIRFYRKTANK